MSKEMLMSLMSLWLLVVINEKTLVRCSRTLQVALVSPLFGWRVPLTGKSRVFEYSGCLAIPRTLKVFEVVLDLHYFLSCQM